MIINNNSTTTIGRAVVDVVSCSVTTTDSFEIDREVSISFRDVIEKWHLGFWPILFHFLTTTTKKESSAL